ncbi:MAG: hypothetical protein IJR28_02015 [Ottowia sp.]|nr:hypothetical protein [Ottowia sp.]
MSPALFFAVFAVVAPIMAVLVWMLLKQGIARIFTEHYATLRQSLPPPLETYKWASGGLRTKGAPLRWNHTLRLGIYPDMLLASSMGQALRLPWRQHDFTRRTSSLVIDHLPVREKSSAGFFPNPLDFGQETTFTIQLSKKRLDFIETLIKQARGETSQQQ